MTPEQARAYNKREIQEKYGLSDEEYDNLIWVPVQVCSSCGHAIVVGQVQQAWTEADEIDAMMENLKRDAVKWLLAHEPDDR